MFRLYNCFCILLHILQFSYFSVGKSTDLFFEQKDSTVHHSGDDFPFTTVVDLLSQNPEFSVFLRILQVQGHIPYLNSISNFTLLAPVNSAFAYSNEVLENEELLASINLRLQDYILSDIVLNTVDLVPGTHLFRTNSYPVLLRKSGDGRCVFDGKVGIVEPNLTPNSQNATIQGLSSLVEKPFTISELIENSNENTGQLSIMSHIFQSDYLTSLFSDDDDKRKDYFSNKTLFLPTDEALKEYFNEIELNYLFDLNDAHSQIPDHKEDFRLMMKKLLVDEIIGGFIHEDSLMVRNMNGEVFNVFSKNKGKDLVLNGTVVFRSNEIYDEGIVHFVSKLPLIKSDFVFDAEKYIIGMNASSIVQELRFRNLQHLVQSSSIEQTIFIPSYSKDSSDDGVSDLSKSQLLYHFIGKPIVLETEFFEESSHTKFYNSMFCFSTKKLGNNCQRIKISKFNEDFYINEKFRVLHTDPIKIDGTLIYNIENDIELPSDLIHSINPFFDCYNSLNFMQQLNLLDLKTNGKGYTLFLPCFNSWNSIELTVDYLQKNISAMNYLMKSFVLNDLIYSDNFNLTLETTDLRGSTVVAATEKLDKGREASLSLDLSTFDSNIYLTEQLDIIFSQGVVHPLKDVYFPNSLQITLKNLIEATETVEFLLFLEKYEEFKSIVTEPAPYSILVPTPKSLLLERIDLNYTRLENFLRLHLIPQNQTTALLDCEDTIYTASGEPLHCRETSKDVFLLSVGNGLDKEVRILKKGCTSDNNISCVFLIDRPLSLNWLDRERYRIFLPGVSFALGVVLGVLLLFSLSLCIIVTLSRLGTRKVRSRLGSHDSESQSLLQSPINPSSSVNPDQPSTLNSADNAVRAATSFESSYSSNTQRVPITITNPVSTGTSQNRTNDQPRGF